MIWFVLFYLFIVFFFFFFFIKSIYYFYLFILFIYCLVIYFMQGSAQSGKIICNRTARGWGVTGWRGWGGNDGMAGGGEAGGGGGGGEGRRGRRREGGRRGGGGGGGVGGGGGGGWDAHTSPGCYVCCPLHLHDANVCVGSSRGDIITVSDLNILYFQYTQSTHLVHAMQCLIHALSPTSIIAGECTEIKYTE